MQANPDVDLTITATGLTGHAQQQHGVHAIAFLKSRPTKRVDPAQPARRQARVHRHRQQGDLAKRIFMSTVGILIPAMQPQPVLQISTGATARNTGSVSFSISGVDPVRRCTPPAAS